MRRTLVWLVDRSIQNISVEWTYKALCLPLSICPSIEIRQFLCISRSTFRGHVYAIVFRNTFQFLIRLPSFLNASKRVTSRTTNTKSNCAFCQLKKSIWVIRVYICVCKIQTRFEISTRICGLFQRILLFEYGSLFSSSEDANSSYGVWNIVAP